MSRIMRQPKNHETSYPFHGQWIVLGKVLRFSGPYNRPNGPIMKILLKISHFWPIFIWSKNHILIIKKPSFLGYIHPLDDFFDGTFLGYLGAILGTYGLFYAY